MSPSPSPDPSDRLGVYKTFTDVPDAYRLYHDLPAYAGRDVWGEFTEAVGVDEYHADVQAVARRAFDRWTAFMDARNRHYALARPSDAEAWAGNLLADLSERTATQYWWWLHRMYRWLAFHADHEHRYNPFLMAAANGENARRLWDFQMSNSRKQ